MDLFERISTYEGVIPYVHALVEDTSLGEIPFSIWMEF